MKTRRALAPALRELLFLVFVLGFTARTMGQGGPPIITVQPQSQTNTYGTTVSFSVVATSLSAREYQWRFNGVNIAGATNTTYFINNVQAWHAANYSVAITNAVGYAISSNALLTVVVPSGGVIAWGNNQFGQSTVPPGLTNVAAIAAGGSHSMVLRNDGTVLAWGDNDYGQSQVPPGLSNVTAIAGGGLHSVALRHDGTVATWGHLSWMLPPNLSNVVAIAAGAAHSLVLFSDGTVFGWGDNASGQLSPPPGLNEVVAIAAGGNHSLALRRDGNVIAWGENDFNQTNVPGTLGNVVALAAGNAHCMALRNVGNCVGWGDNSSGQTNPPGAAVPYVAVASGSNFNLGLRNNGTVLQWGGGSYGPVAVPMPPNLTNLTAVSARGLHSLALQGNGAPVITVQPFSQKASAGDPVRFTVEAVGVPILKYQWRFNGANIPGATASALNYILPNAQLANIGAYSVVVTNNFGMVTSSVATLEVTDTAVHMKALGFSPAGFSFRVTGSPGIYIIAVSPNLSNWFDVLTTNLPGSGTLDLLDPTAGTINQRAYRARRYEP